MGHLFYYPPCEAYLSRRVPLTRLFEVNLIFLHSFIRIDKTRLLREILSIYYETP